MAFDFFNNGLTKESTAEFTKAENQLLESKLIMLDPKRTGKISLALTLNFVKFSNLRSPDINKIMKYCKKDDQNELSYDDVKRIFRGIGLVQHGIEPTLVNINANIPNKAPKFYDDDDDESEESPSPQKQPPSPPPPKQPAPPTHQPPPVRDAPPKSQQPPAAQKVDLNQKLREFQSQWSRLNTQNNRIGGAEVKQLSKNLAQRSNLSKAWKLCCRTSSGSLTKGEYFVFLEIVGSHTLPQSLSSEMKAAIAHFDHQKPKPTKDHLRQPVPSPSQIATSQVFENFGRSELNVTAPPSPQEPSEAMQKLEAGRKSLAAGSQANQQELVHLRRGQQTMNNMLGEVQQFVGMVSGRNDDIRRQIDELKDKQATLNERLNKVVMAMNGVLVRQNSFIEELMEQMAQRNAVDQQKIAALEQALAISMQQQLLREQQFSQARQQASQSPPVQPVKVEPTQPVAELPPPQPIYSPPMAPKQPIPRQQQSNHQQREQAHTQVAVQEAVYQQQPQGKQAVYNTPPPSQHQQPSPSPPPQPSPSPPPQSPTQELSPEKLQVKNRIKLKQMKLIQMINQIKPITKEQYPRVLQNVLSRSEQELDKGMYSLQVNYQYQEVARVEGQEEKPVHAPAQSGADDFSSSNFAGGAGQNEGGANFFA